MPVSGRARHWNGYTRYAEKSDWHDADDRRVRSRRRKRRSLPGVTVSSSAGLQPANRADDELRR